MLPPARGVASHGSCHEQGGLYVDADELFASPDVQDTIRKMEKLDVTGRSSGPAGTD